MMKSVFQCIMLLGSFFLLCTETALASISQEDYRNAFEQIDALASQGLVETGFVGRIAELQDMYSYDHDILSFVSAVRHYAADVHWGIGFERGDTYLGYKYVKRNQKIFFDRYEVKGANSYTFSVIDKNYAQDNVCVYYQMNCEWSKGEVNWEYLGDEYSVYGGVLFFANKDVASSPVVIELLGNSYARVDGAIYYAGRKMDFDLESFVFLGDGLVKDKTAVYYNNAKTSMDPATTVALGDNYAKDAKAVYHFAQEMNFDPESFDVMALYEHYVADKEAVYFDNQEISGSDPESFEVLAYPFAKDQNYVYERGQKNTRLDAKCFEVIDAKAGLVKDCNGTYQRGQWYDGSLFGRVKNLLLRVRSKL